jgi:hypothetical protein
LLVIVILNYKKNLVKLFFTRIILKVFQRATIRKQTQEEKRVLKEK